MSFVDKHVAIIEVSDETAKGIKLQLLKAAFKSFYDILDKIAFFINDYLSLGNRENKVYFSSLWYSGRQTGRVRKEITATLNPSLNALFDIHKSLMRGGQYEYLQTTRHALTHRFIGIKKPGYVENEGNVTEETLNKRAIELAKIVRNAVIYLLYFVHFEESKKEYALKQ